MEVWAEVCVGWRFYWLLIDSVAIFKGALPLTLVNIKQMQFHLFSAYLRNIFVVITNVTFFISRLESHIIY